MLAACALMTGCGSQPGLERSPGAGAATAPALSTPRITHAAAAARPAAVKPAAKAPVGTRIPTSAVRAKLLSKAKATRYGWSAATRRKVRTFATTLPWRLVKAAGVTQAIACTGTGRPTVVYVNGWNSPAVRAWPLTAITTSRITRVCLFDRPGNGLSPTRAKAKRLSTPQQQADEMLALLAKVGERGPFVLVPWSYGGLVARAAAAQHPDRVAGMVLVDAMSPLRSNLAAPWHGEKGIVDNSTIGPTVGSGPDMGDRPVIVLTEETFAGWSEAGKAESLALQAQAATISTNSVHGVVLGSDHHIPMRNAKAVAAATAAVVLSVRSHDAPLGACPAALAAHGVTCEE